MQLRISPYEYSLKTFAVESNFLILAAPLACIKKFVEKHLEQPQIFCNMMLGELFGKLLCGTAKTIQYLAHLFLYPLQGYRDTM